MTDDGDLANLLTHPGHAVAKIYRVSVRGIPDEKQLEVLSSPLLLEGETDPIEPVEVFVVDTDRQKNSARLEMTLYEGRNRQIRKMCAAAGLEVTRLRRIRIGNISVNGIAPGTYRVLTQRETDRLRSLAKQKREKTC